MFEVPEVWGVEDADAGYEPGAAEADEEPECGGGEPVNAEVFEEAIDEDEEEPKEIA